MYGYEKMRQKISTSSDLVNFVKDNKYYEIIYNYQKLFNFLKI